MSQTGNPTDASTPADLELRRKSQALHITWRDGAETTFPLAMLRRHCPCASCRTERESKKLLPVLSFDPTKTIEVVDAKMMGNYAIQLIWSDGHDTGIFDYTYLRALGAKLDASP
jgi:DUF971 family protein